MLGLSARRIVDQCERGRLARIAKLKSAIGPFPSKAMPELAFHYQEHGGSRMQRRRGVTMRTLVLGLAIVWLGVAKAGADLASLRLGIQAALAELATCDPTDIATPCNQFVCKALVRAYGTTAALDFQDAAGDCALANDIHETLWGIAGGTKLPRGPLGWSFLGTAENPATLERAQACANAGFATLVSSRGPAHGHIVLVVPGALENSPSWQTSVPKVAGRRIGVVGTPGEVANSNEVRLSAHWAANKRADAKIFVEGTHEADPQSSGCH